MRVKDHAVERLAEAVLPLGRHPPGRPLPPFRALGEGAVREAASLGNVGDPGIEEPVLLEDLLCCSEETRTSLDSFAGTGPTGLFARVRRRRFWHHSHASFRWSRSTPDGVPPPDVTTAVLAPATWRGPASWRNCVTAS